MIILKSELKSSLQERSFKVFLYTAILCALTEHSITGYEINRFFLKKHRVFIVPAQLTPVDYHGKKGWIEYIRNKGGRVYALTEKGGKIVAKMAEITREIQGVIRIILKCYD